MKQKWTILLLFLVFLGGCNPGNPSGIYPPIIGDINASKTAVACNERITLSLEQKDISGEHNLHYYWLFTDGAMDNPYSPTVIWQAPPEKKGVTLMVEITDETGSFKTTRSIYISVAPYTTAGGQANDMLVGGSSTEKTYPNCLAKSPSGNLLFAMTTSSYDAAASDILLTAFSGTGDILWQKTYGLSGWDSPGAAAPLPDGGFIVWATASDEEGNINLWVFRIDSTGNLKWEKQYRLKDYNHITAAAVTDSGELLAAGQTFSFDTYTWTPMVLKLDSMGEILWMKTFATGSTNDYVTSLHLLKEENLLVSGHNEADSWLMKTDARGEILWQKNYDTTHEDTFASLVITEDNGFLAAGTMKLTDSAADNHQMLLLKLDSDGNIMWNKTYGGQKSTIAGALIETTDRGFLLAGTTDWFGQGAADWLLFKLDSGGNILWQKTVGGANDDLLCSARALPGNGAFLGGYSRSFGDHTDGWIMNIDGAGESIYNGRLTYMIPGSITVTPSDGSTASTEVLFEKEVLSITAKSTVKTIQ